MQALLLSTHFPHYVNALGENGIFKLHLPLCHHCSGSQVNEQRFALSVQKAVQFFTALILYSLHYERKDAMSGCFKGPIWELASKGAFPKCWVFLEFSYCWLGSFPVKPSSAEAWCCLIQ